MQVDEFDYKSNERIFGGDYSEKHSLNELGQKSISISELSGIEKSGKKSHDLESLVKKAEKSKTDLININKFKEKSMDSHIKFGSSILFGDSMANGGWCLQTPILCSKHKKEEIMYWESEEKELLCGECLLGSSGRRQRSKGNLKSIQKSLPHIKQTVEDTVNDVHLQWQFLKNKRKELEICQGSLTNQRRSLENKFKIEIKDFFSHCVDVKNNKVSNLKSHFQDISERIDGGLQEMQEKEGFLSSVTNAFGELSSGKASPEQTIGFYCENIREIDSQLEEVKELNEKVETLGGKGLFHYSSENSQVWFLKYLLGFYEKLSEFVFERKTFFKEKLNNFEHNFKNISSKDLPSFLKYNSSSQNLEFKMNQRTKKGKLPNQISTTRQIMIPEGVNFHSQMNNPHPSSKIMEKDSLFRNYDTPLENMEMKKLSHLENLSEMKEDISKHPMDSQVYQNDSSFPEAKLRSKQYHSKRGNKKSSMFSHKKQNFSNPMVDSNFQGYEHVDPYYKFSNKKKRRKNFTTTPKNCLNSIINKNFHRKSQAIQFEVNNQIRNKSGVISNGSHLINTSRQKLKNKSKGVKTNRDKRKKHGYNFDHKRHLSNLDPLTISKLNPQTQVNLVRIYTPTGNSYRCSARSIAKNSKSEREQKWNSKRGKMKILSNPINISKSSKNLQMPLAVTKSITKLKTNIKSKIGDFNENKSKKNHDFFRKKYTQHKKKYSEAGMRIKKGGKDFIKNSSSYQSHLKEIGIQRDSGSQRNKNNLTKATQKYKNSRIELREHWKESNIRKHAKQQKWEKEENQRVKSMKMQEMPDSLDSEFSGKNVI